MTTAVVGIDLGTTNSVVATVDDRGEVIVLRNAIDEETTPSAVYFESGECVVVGEEARLMTAIDPDHGVILIKRAMGTEFPLRIHGQAHTPESISALILRQLVTAAPNPSRVRAVITVPAYFGTPEREATIQAGRIAGVEVLELVDEPVAAAIHYGLLRPGDRTVLVYDLGGGTFDTTVLSIAGGEVEVMATDGHARLGGADVDARLQEIVLGRLRSMIPAEDYDDLLDDERKLGGLIADVEDAKRRLSDRVEFTLTVRTASDRLRLTLRREEMDRACEDLFTTTMEIIDRVLAAARAKGVTQVDEVVMVGGSSRIPLLASKLQQRFGARPMLIDPDLAVAKGAALRAHQIVQTSQLRALVQAQGLVAASAGVVMPVLPRALGLLIEDSNDPSGQRQFVAHLIDANTPLPAAETTRSYGTVLPRQEAVRIQLYEQAGSAPSEEVEHNRRILDGELSGIGELPEGATIEVTLEVAIDGRIGVTALEPISGKWLTLEAFVEGVVDAVEVQDLERTVGLIAVRG